MHFPGSFVGNVRSANPAPVGMARAWLQAGSKASKNGTKRSWGHLTEKCFPTGTEQEPSAAENGIWHAVNIRI